MTDEYLLVKTTDDRTSLEDAREAMIAELGPACGDVETQVVDVGGLVEQWREEASHEYVKGSSEETALKNCADELESLLED